MRKPKNSNGLILITLLFVSQIIIAQSAPIPIHGVIDKPDTKFALYELFYTGIDDEDIDPNEAELTEQFLIVKNHNAKISQGKLIIDGVKVFTTDLDQLPFLPSVSLLNQRGIWPTELDYYHDNFENITTQSESYERVNNPTNFSSGGGCINFVIDNDEENSFNQNFINVFNELTAYLSGILCCPGSSPVTFVIQPATDIELGSASPQYLNSSVDTQGDCNAISQNPFMNGLNGEPQDEIAIIQINPTVDWYFGEGNIGNNQFDLFTVLLHEFMHGIGLASRITEDGSPLGSGFSPWDQFLEINGQPLLERENAPEGSDCCYIYNINEDLDLPEDIISASENGQISIAGIPVCYHEDVTAAAVMENPALFYNMLSHLDEDCDDDTATEYVINGGLAPEEIRDEISEDELFLLQTLGYCTNESGEVAPSCYASLVDDFVIVTEGDEDAISVNVFSNDILPTGFVPSEIIPDLSCGDASGISVVSTNEGFDIQGLIPGNYCFCYSIEPSDITCTDFCDKGEVCVFVRPAVLGNGCEPEDCSLNCFGDFEDFIADEGFSSSNTFNDQIDAFNHTFNNTNGNSADIFNFENNNYLYLAGSNTISTPLGESISFSLNESVEDGCILKVGFDIECLFVYSGSNSGPPALPANIFIFASENPICENPVQPPNEDICPGSGDFEITNFSIPQPECTENELQFDIEVNNFSYYEYEWNNSTGQPINYITILNLPFEGVVSTQVFIDNISITSSCETEIQLTDITPPDNLIACAGGSVTIDYEICLTGEGDETIEVILDTDFDNAPLGSVSANPLSLFANGPVTIELSTGECQTVSLVVDLAPDLIIGQEVEVIMLFDSEDVCNQQDGQVSTIITIGDEPPTSDFAELVECMNDPPTVSFSALEPNNPTTTFAWNFGDGNSSTDNNPTHTYAQSGVYKVTLEVENECGVSTTTKVINFDCDDDPPVDCPCSDENRNIVLDDPDVTSYSLSQLVDDGTLPQNVFSGCINLNGILNVDVDYMFQGATLIMEPESAIVIESNYTLSSEGSTFMGCTALWNGILVNANASLRIGNNSYISDAVYAVHLLDRSSLSCQDNVFNKNYVGIYIPPNPNDVMNTISFPLRILRNTFECEGDLLPDENGTYNLLFDDKSYSGILVNDAALFIGRTRSNPEPSNIFRDMYNGVRSFNSIFTSSHSLFSNIISNENDVETGHGIYNVNSSIFSSFNTFEKTEYGIRGNQSTLKSTRDIYDSIKVGIEMAAAPPEGFVSSFDCNYSNYTERAIVVYNSPSTIIDILSNTMTNDQMLDYTFQEAIAVFDNGSKNGAYTTIEGNTMILGENQAGISLANVLRAEVNRNGVIFVDDPQFNSAWSRGFKMSNCIFTNLEDNSVIGSILPSSGFETEDSPNQTFICNNTSDTKLGIKFKGLNCAKTDLETNGMTNSQDAGLSLENTIIGGQEHKGNLWCEGDVASFSGDFNLIPSSLFEVDETDGDNICKTLPPTNVDDWFGNFPGLTRGCEVGQGGESILPIRIEAGDFLAARQGFTGQYSETSNWTIGRYLLKNLEKHPEMLGLDSEIDGFYNSNFNSSMKQYNDLQDEILNIYEVDESLKSQIETVQFEMARLRNLIDDLDYEIIQSVELSERQILIGEKFVVEENLADNFGFYKELLQQVELDKIQRANELRIVNNNLVTPNLSALNEKRLNFVTLNMIVNPAVLNRTKVRNQIESIANQCPASGGLAVYEARSLWDYINPGNQNDYSLVDDCYQENQNRVTPFDDTIEIKNQTKIEVFPNPTSGTVSISLEKSLVDGHIIITDLLGREVQAHKIGKDETWVILHIKADPGIYFISIIDEDENLKNLKIIKQ